MKPTWLPPGKRLVPLIGVLAAHAKHRDDRTGRL